MLVPETGHECQPWGFRYFSGAMSCSIALSCLLGGLFAWVNQRYFQLPVTIGLMLALLNALAPDGQTVRPGLWRVRSA